MGESNPGSEEFISFGKEPATMQIEAKAGNETENGHLIQLSWKFCVKALIDVRGRWVSLLDEH